MKKLFVLLTTISMLMFTNYAFAGFDLGGLVGGVLSQAASDSANKRAAVTELSNKYTYHLGFMSGILGILSEEAEKNDYNKLVKIKNDLNDDNNPRAQTLVKSTNVLMGGNKETGANIPDDVFTAFQNADKAAVLGFVEVFPIMLDPDKETRCLTTAEIEKINNLSVAATETAMLYLNASNKALGKGSLLDISAKNYKNVSLGQRYQKFVSTFCYPGTLIKSEQKMVNGSVVKTDTYKWQNKKAVVTAVFENGKATSITPLNLK